MNYSFTFAVSFKLMDDFVFHRNSLRWWDWSTVRWRWLNLFPFWRKTRDCRALETVLVRYCETKQHKYSWMHFDIFICLTHESSLQVYLLMEQCWDFNPGQRPSFSSLAESLKDIRRTYKQQPSVQLAQLNHRWPALSCSLCAVLTACNHSVHYEPDQTWLIGLKFLEKRMFS